MQPFSPISEAIILFSVPAVFWHLQMVLFAGRASALKHVVVGATVLAWTAYGYLAVRYGIDQTLFGDLPIGPLLYVALAVLAGLLFSDLLLGNGVPQQLLIALQLFRPIGLIFVLEDARGMLPPIFAQPAGWGDLIAGLVALAVLLRYPRGHVPARAVLLVAIVGIADFASAFFFGFTSSASPVQLFSFEDPNRVLEYPLGLIPVFLVPYAIIAHILSLRQMAKDKSARL